MPVHRPVPSLQVASMHTVASVICNALPALDMQRIQKLDDQNLMTVAVNYLSLLPDLLKEELLHYILSLEPLDTAVRFSALKTILFPHLKSLTPGRFPVNYFKNICNVLRCQATFLESLDLRGIWLNRKFSCELQNVLPCLKNLRRLCIPHMATNSILETIGLHNTSLVLLDITGQCIITEAGAASLSNNGQSAIIHNLKFVLLGGNLPVPEAEVTPRAVSILIKYLPKLQSLGSYPYVALAIECLINESSNITTNLTQLHDRATDVNRIKLLIRSCPMLQSISIHVPASGVLHEISQFSYLNEVKLSKFKNEEFLKFIDKNGTKFLSIHLFFGTGILDIGYMSKLCPNLTDFTEYKRDYVKAIDRIQFPQLKNIELFTFDISSSCFRNMMMGLPNIIKLCIESTLEITDNDITEIFSVQEFAELKHIWLPKATRLTSVSVQILMECCPNLMTLGDIKRWDLLPYEVNIFEQKIKNENLAIELIIITPDLHKRNVSVN